MARKKSNDSAAALGVLVFVALATLITLASALYGLVALVAWNYYARKSSRIETVFSEGYFLATREESRRIEAAEKALADARKNLNNLNAEGKGLSRRIDGDYDERSTLGKRLNRETTTALSNEKAWSLELAELKNYSAARLDNYLGIKSGASAWRKAGIAYVIAALGFMVFTPDWVVGLNGFLGKSGWFGSFNQIPMLWGALAAAAAVSLLVQQVVRFYSKHATEQMLEQGKKPAMHAAIRFTEMLAAETGIGLCDSADFVKAETIFKERQAQTVVGLEICPKEPIAVLIDVPVEPALPSAIKQPEKNVSEPLKTKRALWKRLLSSVGFGVGGFVCGFLIFGLSGQGNLGVALVLLLPVVGLTWGFNFKKYA